MSKSIPAKDRVFTGNDSPPNPGDTKDEVIVDEARNETYVIPSDIASTDLKDANGAPVPDRVVSILLTEYGEYPEEFTPGYMKSGGVQVFENVGADKDRVMEIQKYVLKDADGIPILDENGKEQVSEIRKTIINAHYPVVKKLRELIDQEKGRVRKVAESDPKADVDEAVKSVNPTTAFTTAVNEAQKNKTDEKAAKIKMYNEKLRANKPAPNSQ